MWNDAALALLRRTPEDVAGARPPFAGADRVFREDGSELTEDDNPAVAVLRDDDAPRETLLRRVRPDGTSLWLVARYQPLRAGSGGLVCTFEDVTERVDAERRLRDERDRAQRYLDVASTMMVVLGADATVQLVNRRGAQVLGHAEEDLLGRDWFDAVVPPDERLGRRMGFSRLVSGIDPHVEDFETTVRTRDGELRTIAWHSALLHDEHGDITGVLRSGEDVTERRRAEEQVRHAAYHDRLTGLPNRLLLEEHLALAVARARRNGTGIALLCVDLDDFQLVNDSLGHGAGDRVLRETAERLRRVTRANDLLAHQGADAFLLLLADLEDVPAEAATVVGRVIREALDAPFAVDDAVFHVTASIGIAVFPDHADNADDLLKRADTAMQQAKRRGERLTLFQAPAVDARTRLSLTARLRAALDRDEFELHFQPLVEPVSGTIRAAEALIRWNDPQDGLVAPALFIPTAEETGMIDAIGEWVLDALCRQAKQWPGLRLSFNVSPRELRRDDLARSIIRTVAAHGLPPSSLCVELTESSAMAQAGAEVLMHDLSAAGFTLALDDFGTGHSSLTRLRELPFHVLKIDRSFLAPVPHDPQAASIVAAVLALGRALGMTTVAEGVETEEQRRFLVEHGCALLQGFLLGRPVPAAELAVPAARP
jgi:diguanylate cyclase (GGDEF)-like protein/PAS domain S-box-containing protein